MWADSARWALLPWTLLAVVVGLALVATYTDRRRGNLFAPLSFAAWSHVLPAYGVGGLMLVSGWRSPVMHLLPDEQVLTHTMAYAMAGFAALGLGFLTPGVGRVAGAVRRRLPSITWQPVHVLAPTLLLLALGTWLWALAFDRGLVGYQVAATPGPYDAVLVIGATTLTVVAQALLALVAVSPVPRWARIVAVVAFAARAGTDLTLSGQRGALLTHAFVFAAAYATTVGRLRWRQLAVIWVGFAAAIVVGIAYGSTFREVKGDQAVIGLWATGRTSGAALRATLDRGLVANLVFVRDRLAARVEIVSNAAVIVAHYRRLAPLERAAGLQHGITAGLRSALVPRAVWPGKPAVSDGRAFGMLYFGFPNSFAVTAPADLLRNYGPVGVVVGMACLGALLRLGYGALVEQQDPTMWRQAAYISLLLTVSYEGFFGSIVPMLLRVGMVTALALVGVDLARRLSARIGEAH